VVDQASLSLDFLVARKKQDTPTRAQMPTTKGGTRGGHFTKKLKIRGCMINRAERVAYMRPVA
jgi:hypothetical protein